MSGTDGLHPKVELAITDAVHPWRVVRHDSMDREIRSPHDFADALGWDAQRITKSLLLRTQRGDAFVIIVCPATSKLDFKKVGALLEGRYEVASRSDLDEVVGYPITGVTPLGVSADVPVVVHTSITEFESVMTGGGTVGVEVEIAVADLINLTSATIASVIK